MSRQMGKARYLLTAIDYFFLGYFCLVRGLARVLPPRFLYAIFAGLGYTIYYLVPGTRNRACSNIKAALPELDDRAVKRIGRSSYGELLKDMPDLVIFARHKERMWSQVEVEGLEPIDVELEKGNGGICICAHVGAWAIAMGMMIGRGYQSTPIIVNPERTLTPRLIKAIEDFADSVDAADGYILTGEGSVEKTTECLKQGKIVVITVDVIGSRVVEFFGRPAALASGIGHFAYETGAPLATGRILRTDDPLKMHLVFEGPLEVEITGDRDADIQAVMQASARAIERQVRGNPEQWTQWGALGNWWKKAEKLAQQSER